MIMPNKNEFNLITEMFNEPFFKKENKIMKTDISKLEDKYIIDIELPGYTKDEIKISVLNGIINIEADKQYENKNQEESTYVYKERYYGKCFRSFYIGEEVKLEDIKANLKNGILHLEVILKNESKNISSKKYIQIED